MIDAGSFITVLKRLEFSQFVGVPCSYLKPFINYVINDNTLDYIGATHEGEAVAIAPGCLSSWTKNGDHVSEFGPWQHGQSPDLAELSLSHPHAAYRDVAWPAWAERRTAARADGPDYARTIGIDGHSVVDFPAI